MSERDEAVLADVERARRYSEGRATARRGLSPTEMYEDGLFRERPCRCEYPSRKWSSALIILAQRIASLPWQKRTRTGAARVSRAKNPS